MTLYRTYATIGNDNATIRATNATSYRTNVTIPNDNAFVRGTYVTMYRTYATIQNDNATIRATNATSFRTYATIPNDNATIRGTVTKIEKRLIKRGKGLLKPVALQTGRNIARWKLALFAPKQDKMRKCKG